MKTMFGYMSPADKPVVEELKRHEIIFAAYQPQYIPLRAICSGGPEGRVISQWTFTPEQRNAIAEGADLFLELSTFGTPLQPIRMIVAEEMDIDFARSILGLSSNRDRDDLPQQPDRRHGAPGPPNPPKPPGTEVG